MTKQKSAIGKAYVVKLAEESRILRTHRTEKYGDLSQEASSGFSDIAEVIYPLGTSGFQTGTSKDFFSLERATCCISNDSVMAMQLQMRPTAPETIILTGRCVSHNPVDRVHIKGTGLYGLRIAIDGICHAEKNGYLLTGLLSVSIRGITQIENIKLRLCEVIETILTDKLKSAIQEFRKDLNFSKTIPLSPKMLSEASEYINGIPVPTIFDATIIPSVDGSLLPQMQGQLMLNKLEGSHHPTIYITLSTNNATMKPGWSAWMTANDHSSHPTSATAFDEHVLSQEEVGLPKTFEPTSPSSLEEGVEITTEGQRIYVNINPVIKFRQLIWQAENE